MFEGALFDGLPFHEDGALVFSRAEARAALDHVLAPPLITSQNIMLLNERAFDAVFKELLSGAAFEIDVTVTGFEMGAIDVMIGEHAPSEKMDEADAQPPIDPDRPAITKPGDL